MRTWDAHACREQFPALRRTVHNHPAVYFDGPAGSQVPARVIEAVSRYLAETNATEDPNIDLAVGKPFDLAELAKLIEELLERQVASSE